MDSNLRKLFQEKKRRRSDLARLPLKEKIRILIQLQKMANPLAARKGLLRRPWKIAV